MEDVLHALLPLFHTQNTILPIKAVSTIINALLQISYTGYHFAWL
jgi:hypothetical protein